MNKLTELQKRRKASSMRTKKEAKKNVSIWETVAWGEHKAAIKRKVARTIEASQARAAERRKAKDTQITDLGEKG